METTNRRKRKAGFRAVAKPAKTQESLFADEKSKAQIYGVKKGTRVFKMLCEIYMHGEAQTGKSGKRFKYVHTSEVIDALQRAGVKCEYFNNAPRCGACGEHVALCGKVKKDVVHNYAKYVKEHSALMWYECEQLYTALL